LRRYTTEETAAQAYNKYVNDGVLPIKHAEDTPSSQCKGVTWKKRGGGGGRGLHSSTSQLNLSRVGHKKTPYTP